MAGATGPGSLIAPGLGQVEASLAPGHRARTVREEHQAVAVGLFSHGIIRSGHSLGSGTTHIVIRPRITIYRPQIVIKQHGARGARPVLDSPRTGPGAQHGPIACPDFCLLRYHSTFTL